MAEQIRSRETSDITMGQLWEDFLARCRAKNLSPTTVEWYGFKLGKFVDWCEERGIPTDPDSVAGASSRRMVIVATGINM